MKTKMNFVCTLIGTLFVGIVSSVALADEVIVPMDMLDAAGKPTPIGNVTLIETADGVLFKPDMARLPPGLYGFHIHENGSCGISTSKEGVVIVGGAAGGHWDPENKGKHEGPTGAGHLGDLPLLVVGPEGRATKEVLAPRIKSLEKLHKLAIMVHAHDDNFSDSPVKLGGSGGRMVCGVIE